MNTFVDPAVISAINKIKAAVVRWSNKFGIRITFGYIGNYNVVTRYDDRSWRVFIEGEKSAPSWAHAGENDEEIVEFSFKLDDVEGKIEKLLNERREAK